MRMGRVDEELMPLVRAAKEEEDDDDDGNLSVRGRGPDDDDGRWPSAESGDAVGVGRAWDSALLSGCWGTTLAVIG